MRSLTAALLIATALQSQPPPATQFALACREQNFAGAVAVQHRGKIVFASACGLANSKDKLPNTPQTQFRVASLAKQFTATAVLLLQQEGKLTVNDPITTYLNDLPLPWRLVTLHQLLTHTSGIPDAIPGQLISRTATFPLRFPPGSKFEHSNTGYLLLEKIIEKVSQLSYPRFLQTRLFEPLELRATIFEAPTDKAPSEPANPAVIWSAEGFYSTTGDLLTWATALQSGKLLTSSSIAQLLQRYPESQTSGMNYGYGIVNGHTAGRSHYFHAGSTVGFTSFLITYPAQELSIALLSNLDTVAASKANLRIVHDFAARFGGPQ